METLIFFLLSKNNSKNFNNMHRSSPRGAAEMNVTGNHEAEGWIPGLTHWSKDPVLP